MFSRDNILPLAFVIVVFGVGGLAVSQYQENKTLAGRVTTLEGQTAAMAQTLQESNILSEENRERLREITSRRDVIARSQDELLTAAVKKATPAVVSIVVSKDVPLLEVQYVNPFGDDPFFQDFDFRVPTYRQVGTEKQQVGSGTGFLVRSDGYLITNRHVVADTEAEYIALLSTGEQKEVQIVYKDAEHDLAVLKISGEGFPVLPFGNSHTLELGQTVVAIGNALGEYNNSVSVGIVSGLNRTIEALDNRGNREVIEGTIQTDAAINPGNSGGPLVDLKGSAIGVNVAVERGANNIGFAIPINDVKSIVNRVLP